MNKGEQSKELFTTCAARLFWRNGYYATGISQILQEANLPKGSFYYYFKSKKDLAKEAIRYYEALILDSFRELALNRQWPDFVDQIHAFLSGNQTNGEHYGCPFATIGAEIALAEPELAPYYAAALGKLHKIFSAVLRRSGSDKQRAEDLGSTMQAIYQGRLLLFRISGDPKHLDNMRHELKNAYRRIRQ